jgi:hypothetical protein
METQESVPNNAVGSTAITSKVPEVGDVVEVALQYGQRAHMVTSKVDPTNGVFTGKRSTTIQKLAQVTKIIPKADPAYEGLKRTEAQDSAARNFTQFYACVGCDPEVFLTNADGVIVPPHTIGFSTDKQLDIYADGFAAEFKPNERFCGAYVGDNIRTCLRQIYNGLPQGVKFDTVDYIHVPKPLRMAAPPEVVQLGCMPSLSAYGDSPKLGGDGRERTHRTSGFHFHFSFNNPEQQVLTGRRTHNPHAPEILNVVRCMDTFGGVGMSLLLRGLEHKERRRMYGRAGEYRLPGHGGIEYRVHSGRVLTSPATYMFALELTRLGMILAEYYQWEEFGVSEEDVRAAINELDYDAGIRVYEKVMSWVQAHFKRHGADTSKLNWLIRNGMSQWKGQSYCTRKEFSLDVAQNWHLTRETYDMWQQECCTYYPRLCTTSTNFINGLDLAAAQAAKAGV